MKWDIIRLMLIARYHETQDVRYIDVSRRVGRLISRRSKAARAAAKARRVIPTIPETHEWAKMRRAIEAGKRIVALDAEWTMRVPITEIGIATYHAGVRTVENIRVTPGGHQFLHGTTRYMTVEQAGRWLNGVMTQADLLVGHALHNDRRQFIQWGYPLPDMEVVDTARWSRQLNESNPVAQGLEKFALRHGIEHRGAHCAGNDAFTTLEVALKLASHDVEAQKAG